MYLYFVTLIASIIKSIISTTKHHMCMMDRIILRTAMRNIFHYNGEADKRLFLPLFFIFGKRGMKN